MGSIRAKCEALRAKCGDLWWYAILVFLAGRSGDAIQAFIGLWLVPKYVPQNELGAALPLLQAGSVFGLPLAVLVIPFSRWLTIYAAQGEKGKVKRLLSLAFTGVAVAFALAVLTARFVLPLFFERLSVAMGSLGFLIVCAGLLGPFSSVFSIALQGLKRFGAMAFFGLISAPVRLVVMLVAMPFRALSGYVLGQMSGPALSIVFSCLSLRKELGPSVKSVPLGREDVRAMFRYTVPIAFYTVVGTLLGTWQALLFRQRLPEVESAAFYMISRLAEVTAYASMTLTAIAFPMAVEASQRREGESPILSKVLLGSLVAGLAVSLALLFLGRPLLELVPLWRGYAPYAGLLAAYAFRMTLCATYGAFFTCEIAAGRFAFMWYWLPLTLAETGVLVVLTGFGAFAGVLPDAAVDWMRSCDAGRLGFFVWWLFGLSVVQTAAVALHLLLRRTGKRRRRPKEMVLCRLAVALFAAPATAALAAEAEVGEPAVEPAAETETAAPGRKWLSLSAYADIETAYVCRGYIWDTRPYSAQSAAAAVDLDMFGIVEASVWTQSAMSDKGTSSKMSRYAYAEADYLLRYYYDIDIADGWRLRNGLGRQWVTNPGYVGGRTLCDWQALQVLTTPWITPYWRLRLIRRPIDETYWVVGAKRSFDICEGLTFTADFFGDLGDSRHFDNLYGPKGGKPGGSYHGGLQALNLVLRLDYRLADHVGLFAFVGQFCLVSDDARDAAKAAKIPESRRDLTFGGIGVSVDF